jgi:hypothetical protein
MTDIGQIVSAKEAGKKHGGRYVWATCSLCGKPRWQREYDFKNGRRPSCINCHNRAVSKGMWRELHFKDRGTNNHGYKEIGIPLNHEFASMRNKGGFVMEHRLVMAQHLGRPLLKSEHVHHQNGIRDDNRIENLELIDPIKHGHLTRICVDCDLRKEIRLLKWQIKELTAALQFKLGVEL